MCAQFLYDSTQLLLKPILLTNPLDSALKPEQQRARATCVERVQEATLANPEDGKQLEALATTLPRTMADIEFALYMLMAHLRGLERTEREGKIHNIVAPAFVDIPKSMNFPVDSAAYMLMLQTMLTQPMAMQQGINNWLIQAANHKLGALITESTKVTGLEDDRADALIQILIDGLSDPDAAKTPVGMAAIVTANINTLARRDC